MTALTGHATEPEAALDLVVRVEAELGDGNETGAGILVGHQYGVAYVLTADHVVHRGLDSAARVSLRFRFWRYASVEAKVADLREQGLDLALLTVDLASSSLPSQTIEELAGVAAAGHGLVMERGDRVFPVGHPQGRSWYVPVDSQPVSERSGAGFSFEFDCEGGASGGAVYDDAWNLVGMIQRYDGKLCLALDFGTVREVAEERWGVPLNLLREAVASGGGADRAASSDPSRAAPPESKRETTLAILVADERGAKTGGDLDELARELEAAVVGTPGVRVADRNSVAAVLEEQEFNLAFGAGDFDASGIGGLLDADYLLIGTLGEPRAERRRVSAYGVDGVVDLYRRSLGLRLVAVSNGEAVYSETVETQTRQSYRQAASAPSTPVDRGGELVRGLVEEARDDLLSALAQR